MPEEEKKELIIYDDENEDDFELWDIGSRIENVASIKLSQNQMYAGVATSKGFRIFKFSTSSATDELLIREAETFPYYEEQGKTELVTDLDFMGDTLILVLAIINQGVIVWDEELQKTLRVYDIKGRIDFVSYSYPFIMLSQESQIIVLNTVLNTSYRYITNVTPLNYQAQFGADVNRKNRNINFFHNKKPSDFVFCYIYENTLVIENFIRELVVGIDLTTLKQSTNKQILQIQTKQIEDLKQMVEGKDLQMNPIKNIIPNQLFPASFFGLHDQQLAISQYLSPQTIKIYHINWQTCRIELVRELYRGKQQKEISINFGPEGIISVLSYDSNYTQGYYDATLHLFPDQPQSIYPQQEGSLIRYYFRTWTNIGKPNDRLNDTLIAFPSNTSFRIISINDFYIYQDFELSKTQIYTQSLKDSQKLSWMIQLEIQSSVYKSTLSLSQENQQKQSEIITKSIFKK